MMRLAVAFTGLLALGGTAYAQNGWDAPHRDRDAVSDRIDHRNERIREERREAEMRAARARDEHRRDHDWRLAACRT